MLFKDRKDGGRKLAQVLLTHHFKNPIVVGLPRGGVVTAKEVSRILSCPMEIVIVRKIGSPEDPEYGIGAMSEDEECFFAPQAYQYDLGSDEVQSIIQDEKEELRRRIKLYRGHHLDLPFGKTIILVDDGLATGVSATAALKYLKNFNPQKLIFAAPVGPQRIRSYFKDLCDEIILLERPDDFISVGSWYDEFNQTSDAEVKSILNDDKWGDSAIFST